MRYSLPAMVLLRASCGAIISASTAVTASPMYKDLKSHNLHKKKRAENLFCEALQYLEDRGYGVRQTDETGHLHFVKKHYTCLPLSCREQMIEAGVHVMGFGLHLPAPEEQEQHEKQCVLQDGLHAEPSATQSMTAEAVLPKAAIQADMVQALADPAIRSLEETTSIEKKQKNLLDT